MQNKYAVEKRVRASVRTRVGDHIRRTGIQRPSAALVYKIASRMASILIRHEQNYLPPEIIRTIAQDCAKYFSTNWDPDIARPAPTKTRGQRASEGEQILHQAARPETKKSIRAIAGQLSIPKSAVQRVLVASGVSRPWEGKISRRATLIMRVIAACTPVDGRRIFDRAELFRAAGVPDDNTLLDEICSAPVSTLIYETRRLSCRGSTWLIVCRGRKPTFDKLNRWFLAAEKARTSDHRNPLAPDQRKYVLDPQPAVVGMEERDISAVIAVSDSSRRLSDWRRYFEATIPVEFDEQGYVDREAILTVVQSALRLTSRPLIEHSPWNWIVDDFTRILAGAHFEVIQNLQGFPGDEMAEMLEYWADKTHLLERIEKGCLPGRSHARYLELFENCRADAFAFLDSLYDPGEVPEHQHGGWSNIIDLDELPDFIRVNSPRRSAADFQSPEDEDTGDHEANELDEYTEEEGYIWPLEERE